MASLLTRSVVTVPQGTWAKIADALIGNADLSCISPHLEEKLRGDLFIVEDDFDEAAYVACRTVVDRSDGSVLGVVIVPTMSCNMNCFYCFEDKSRTKVIEHAERQALLERIEKLLAQGNYRHLSVRWFGGEPLQNVDLVCAVSHELRRISTINNVEFSSDVVTNGFELTYDTAKALSEAGISSAQVTFDGFIQDHNRVRRANGVGSYETMVDNISQASKLLRIRARIHVSPRTQGRLPELIDDLARRGLQNAIEYLYFAPLFNYDQTQPESGFQADERLFLSSKDFAAVETQLIRAALHKGFAVRDPLMSDYGVCTALREHTFVVNPDGLLTKCYLDAGDATQTFGDLYGNEHDPERRLAWRRSTHLNDSECRDCRVSPVCLGGCAKQTISGADKSLVCSPLRYNGAEVLRLLFGSESSTTDERYIA